MTKVIFNFIFKLFGWKIKGKFPDIPKFVAPEVPHTSNWDFPIGILIREITGHKIRFVIKAEWYNSFLKFFFKWLGAYPLDRKKSTNFVDSVVEVFNQEKTFKLNIAPEGTRKRVDSLKTGYYFIARKAKVPIVPIKFDYSIKSVIIGDAFYCTDNAKEDLAFLDKYFAGTRGKIAENSYKYMEPIKKLKREKS